MPSARRSRMTPFSPSNVGRMQTDGRLIQHVQHARGAVSHGTGQLHPLPLSRWTGWTPLDPVTGNQVPDPEAASPPPAKESQMLSAMGRISSGSVCGTPATHSTRSERGIWHTSARPSPRTFGSRAAGRQTGAAAVRADLLPSENAPPASYPSHPSPLPGHFPPYRWHCNR